MRAIVHGGATSPDLSPAGSGRIAARLAGHPDPQPAPGECLVRLRAAALNHRDLWTCRGRRTDAPPVVLGSDGAGEVVAIGKGVRRPRPGEAVIVNPALNWSRGDRAPPPDFEILGHPRDGTLAELVTVPAVNLEPKPEHLDWAEAAALGLSTTTAWRALVSQGGVVPGSVVAIPGIGGGTALAAMQLALAMGARTFVTSRSPQKRARALALGAADAFDSTIDWAAAILDATGGAGADIVIESVGNATWQCSLQVLARGGRLVVYGSTSGDRVETDLVPLFLGWRSILGTTLGHRGEFQAMLRFARRREIVPVIDRRFPLQEGAAALDYLDGGGQFGKVVLTMGH
jgi:zinc-binding alcohol dehydrogenase/oxidoreductase